MTIAFVQNTFVQSTLTDDELKSATFSTTPVLGDLVVVSVLGYGSTQSTSDNKGNSYTQIGSTITLPGFEFAAQQYLSIFYTIVIHTSATFTVTGHSSVAGAMCIFISEYSGVASTSPVDGGPSSTITTTVNGDLIYALGNDNTQESQTYTVGTGYTDFLYTGNFTYSYDTCIEDQIQTTAGSITPSFTPGGATVNAVAFKPAGSTVSSSFLSFISR
jgi:hypothetical protein